jgi:cystathionine gamma-lyase
MADLEGGVGARAYASGMAATHGALMLLKAGDHVVLGSDCYGGTYRLLHRVCDRWNIATTLAPADRPEAIEQAMRSNTKMIWIESIGNPLMSIPDIAKLADLAHQSGALLAVDNTLASPALVRPLELGADIVMHSATKYLGGHSDCLAGILVAREKAIFDEIAFVQNATGGVLGPLESFLLGRGIKTLELRMREQSRSTLEIARWLKKHPRVPLMRYPGLEDHPQHTLAQQQMGGLFGAVLSFQIDGDFHRAKRICESTKLFGLAVSLGAVESLISQPASMSHASYGAEDRKRFGIDDTLIRLSIGLEDPQDLIADLDQAIQGA